MEYKVCLLYTSFGDDVTELMIEEGASDDAESFAYDNMLNGIYQYDIADEKTTCLTEIDHINDLRLLDGDGYYSSKDGYFVFDTESRQTRQLPIDADGKTQYGPLKKSGDFLYYALSEEKSDEVTYYRLKDDKSEELMKLSTEKAFSIASKMCIRDRHGAMCISYSGRCLLSNYFTGRDANKGACTHPCRWKYSVVEEKRPGEYLPVNELSLIHI